MKTSQPSPPGYKEPVPLGYVHVPSTTYNCYSLLRIIVKTQEVEDMKKGIEYLHTLKIHPLAAAANPPTIRFIDLADKPFEAVPLYDSRFYDSLARMLAEEPVQDRDLAIMGQWYSLGIGKGLEFKPDTAMRKTLDAAAKASRSSSCSAFTDPRRAPWMEAGSSMTLNG